MIRDAIAFVFGLSGIAFQQVTQDVNVYLLVIFCVCTGLPGFTSVRTLLHLFPGKFDTTSSSSASQSPVSTPDSGKSGN